MKYFLALLLISLAIGKSLHSAAAQQKDQVPRIGFLAPARTGTSFYSVFRDALRSLGYVEGKSVAFEFRSGDNRARLTTLATELVQRNVHIIVTPGGAVNAARTATTTIPIVFSFSGDPVEAGLVQSLAKPAGNMTGLTWLSFELVGKRLELLKEAVPHIARVAVLANPAHPGEKRELQETQSTARQLGIKLLYQQIGPTDDLEAILSSITKGDPDALLVFPDSVTLDQSKNIARFAVAQRPSPPRTRFPPDGR